MNEQLMKIFSGHSIGSHRDNGKIIRELTMRVEPKRISLGQWKQVRHVCAVSEIHHYDLDFLRHEVRMSDDASWLIFHEDLMDLNTVLDRCGQNLLFLRAEMTLSKPLDLTPMKQLRFLHAGKEHDRDGPEMYIRGLEQLTELETLRLMGRFDFWTLDLSNMKRLRELGVWDNRYVAEVKGLNALSELRMLAFWGAERVTELDFSGLKQLEFLHLGYMRNLQTIPPVAQMPNLQTLSMYNNPAMKLQTLDLTGLHNLESIILSDNRRLRNITGLETLQQLKTLKISDTAISRVPDGLRGRPLNKLDLSGLALEDLPDWLPEFGLRFSTDDAYFNCILLKGTKVKNVDMSIFSRSQDMILQWFEARRKDDSGEGPLNEIKVVFLGDGSTGKSLTVARLLGNGAQPEDFDGEATPGIAIKDRHYMLDDGRKVQVHFWDFGGQEILHSMHRIFLTDRTLYVVMINARNNTQNNQARYWLHNVSTFASGCPVLLVLNQIDQNPNASVDERSLKRLYPNLRQIIRLSALTFDQDTFNRALTQKMLEQIAAFDSLGTIFPASWKKIMTRIRGMNGNYIRGNEFKTICRENGVKGWQMHLDLLKWFHDIGVSFCCGKTVRLQDYVVLKPEWITNAIYTIIWNKRSETANGMVDREEIYRLLTCADDDTVRRVHDSMPYELADVDFILGITRQFRLSFSMDSGKEFIPMLCNANTLPEAEDFLDEPGVIEFRMQYEYLPINVLHRLMVDMRQDLRTDKVWLTGALLRQKYNGIDALIRAERNELYIHIKAADTGHKAHTYLNTLRSTLDEIHRDMGLKRPQTQVAYTRDGETEYFAYEMLEGLRKNKVETVYSMTFDRMIPIDDILNGTDSAVEQKKKKLLKDVALACIGLQQDRLMTSAAEDDRNDRVRDALRYMGYRVADQTHVGTGRTGIRAGSLDLQILDDDRHPWTNLEAMNLHSASRSQLAYWEDHLDRLMHNYNPTGLPTLFLLSYVSCRADQFSGLFTEFTEHMGRYWPRGCEPRPSTQSEVLIFKEQPAHLRVSRCTYDVSGTPVVVYHYFVGFIKDSGTA